MKKLMLLLVLLLVGCQQDIPQKIAIAEQYGLAYAPIQIMKEQGFLQGLLPSYDIEWKQLNNTTAIREAMLANQLDVGFLGIPPFIIGYDKGAEWKVFTGLSRAPLALMAKGIKSLEDITPEMKIALPQPGSIQHILLSMSAERTFGQADYFDNQLVTMKHPDGMQAVLSGAVDAHFTSPPYLFEEENKGLSPVVTGQVCMGEDFTFIVGVTTAEFHDNEEAYKAIKIAINKSLAFIYDHPQESIDILGQYYDYDLDLLKAYVYDSNLYYEKEILGIQEFVDFMYKEDYIDQLYEEEELIW